MFWTGFRITLRPVRKGDAIRRARVSSSISSRSSAPAPATGRPPPAAWERSEDPEVRPQRQPPRAGPGVSPRFGAASQAASGGNELPGRRVDTFSKTVIPDRSQCAISPILCPSRGARRHRA